MTEYTFNASEEATFRGRMRLAYEYGLTLIRSGRGVDFAIRERKSKRNNEQNKKLNAMCGDLSEQVLWHGQAISKDDWRHMFVAAYRKEQRIVPGINGGFVVLGASSRNLTVSECSD